MAMLRPASEMKDSGIEWVGQIPNNWSAKKARWLFTERNSKGNPVSVQLLTPSQKYGVLPQVLYQEVSGTKPVQVGEDKDLSEFKTVRRGDFCISLSAYMGGFEYSDYDGVISPAYHSFYKISDDINNAYYRHLFKSFAFIDVVNLITPQSVRVGRNTSFESFKEVVLPIPPLAEQQAIADYLDDRCSKIDEIITEATASIEEYKELKKVFITEMVAGVNADFELKESHYDYLGIYPKHWNVIPISQLFTFIGGYAYKSDRFIHESDYQVIRMGNVKNDSLLLDANPVYISAEDALISNKARLKESDMLFTMTGTKGKGDYMFTLLLQPEHLFGKELYLNQRVGCFRKKYKNIFMPYYNYLLKSEKVREYIFLFETGTANQGNIGIETLNRIRLYNPPYEEQVEIVDYLDDRIAQMDALISEKQALIDDLQAYKKSLIYEVVTGKRRVV